MYRLFATVAQRFDQPLDAVLAPTIGNDLARAMGAVGAIMVGALLTIGLAISVGVFGRQVHSPEYFVVAQGKAPAPMRVLNSPSLSAEKIVNWSNRAVRDIFRFNFRDIDSRLESNSVYFTEGSWAEFRASMEKTEMVEKVKGERLFVSLTPMEDPQLIDRVSVNGQEVLRVEVPVVITYIGGAKPVFQRRFIELFLLPVPSTDDPEGLAIAKLSAKPYR